MNDDTRKHIVETIDQWMQDIQDRYAKALRDLAVSEQENDRLSLQLTSALRALRKTPTFGGPHDIEAVKWAEERGYVVVKHDLPQDGDYIILADELTPDRWYRKAAVKWDGSYHDHRARYILAPKEGAKQIPIVSPPQV